MDDLTFISDAELAARLTEAADKYWAPSLAMAGALAELARRGADVDAAIDQLVQRMMPTASAEVQEQLKDNLSQLAAMAYSD